jgi:asparagine synthetase B (glutamine-hydrolysing)
VLNATNPDQVDPPINLLPADDQTVRWNFQLPSSFESIDPRLLRAAPVDPERRERYRRAGSVFDVLVDAITEQLTDQPVYVEFSGGCDSSLVLSAALKSCRDAQHAPPIPITFRYPLIPETNETVYQEAVFEYLGINNGRVFEITNEFDLLGPSARNGLKAFGLVCPALPLVRADLMRQLEPGLVLSGEGGDESLGPRRAGGAVRAVRALKRGRLRGFAGNVMTSLMPLPLRRHWIRRGSDLSLEWISPQEHERYNAEIVEWWTAEPLRPSRFAEFYLTRPGTQVTVHQVGEVMRWCGHRYGAPLMEQHFVHAVGDLTPLTKLQDRRRILNHHFTSNLPEVVLNRIDKKFFQAAFFNTYAKEFARSWSGQISDDCIDGAKLKAHWLQDDSNNVWSPTFLLLQKAWLESQA